MTTAQNQTPAAQEGASTRAWRELDRAQELVAQLGGLLSAIDDMTDESNKCGHSDRTVNMLARIGRSMLEQLGGKVDAAHQIVDVMPD